MPKREDIHKVLIIGSGPIIIGQACEFDYSGTQACKALRKLGYEIVLVNSNPATIMTDPETADVTYIEPLNVDRLEQIIAKERPDALLPNLGGQSGLNLCSELNKAGVLDKYGVKVIGVQVDAIERGEDRIEFKNTMNELGIGMARSDVSYSVEEALEIADRLGYPVVLRPAYTMGGAGGGLVYNKEELKTVCARGLQASLVGQVLVEESVLGWEELELEVVRDSEGNMITVCFIENIDPIGVHTGDSFCSAPMLTIPEDVQKELQRQAYSIVDKVQVIGGTNVQFARNPKDGRIIVIEINPRTSRSSALASKATGFPIALVSAMLATGLTLKDIPCGKYGTLDKYVPDGDYVVIKFARWAFEKFKGVEDKLGTQMRAVGEVMSIGKNYKEAFQKAIRSLETGRYGLGHVKNFDSLTKEELLAKLITPSSERHFAMYEALRKGATVEEIYELTKVKTYFIEQMKELVEEEERLIANKGKMPADDVLTQAKKDGFSDKYLSKILEIPEEDIRNRRIAIGVEEAWEGVHVSGTKDSAYYFSTYNSEDKDPVSDKKKIMILGGGPNRIGQGIEFDYCCVHAAMALKKLGFETIIVNCNPETVSTDYDTSDKLYFEPLTTEDVLSIYKKEKPLGVIAQFGGQTPLNLAAELEKNGVKILGTSPAVIDLAEDRDQFREMMDKLGIPMPESGMAVTVEEAKQIASKIGYPVMVRPSYVLGGRGMEVVYDDDQMSEYMAAAVGVTPDRPILIDRFFLIHITLRIAWGITFKLTLIEGTHKLTDGLLVDLSFRQALADVVMRELFHRDSQFVAHIAPEGTEHLVVELARLVVCHQARSLLQALGSHLVGPFATLLGDIGILDGPLAEDHEEGNKDDGQNDERTPIARRTKEEIVERVLSGSVRLDMTDILVQQLQVFLSCEITHLRTAGAFSHIEREALRLHRLILTGCGIKEHKLHRRYLELTGMTGHGEDIVDHRTFHTIRRQLGLIRNLGIVLVEILGESHLRLFDELQVTHTTDDNTQRDGIIGLGFGLVELGRNSEISHTTREIGRALRQRIHLNIDAGGNDLLLHFHIAGATVEEGLEGIDVTVLLHHDTIEGNAGDLQFTRQLGEHHILAPRHGTIRTAIERLDLEALLLREIDLLRMEALQIGHLTLQLRQRHQGPVIPRVAFVR